MGTEVIVAAIITAIGTGVSVYSSVQSGKAQNAIAQMNAAAQSRNAKNQLMASQAQFAMQKNAAAAEFALRSQEAAAAENNAVSLENQVITDDRINRANLARKRQDYARMQGEQRASIIASGLVESTGTPLDLLAETAATIQMDQEEGLHTNEMSRRSLFREADLTRLGGQMALAGATLDQRSKLASASLDNAGGYLRYQAGKREANILRLTGNSAQRTANLNATATLFSGAGSMYQSYASSTAQQRAYQAS